MCGIIYSAGGKMKWSIKELYHKQNIPFEFEIDLYETLCDKVSILDISLVIVSGTYSHINYNKFKFILNIYCSLVLPDSITLEPIDYVFDQDFEEIFDIKDSNDEVINLIQNDIVDLTKVVEEEIRVSLPLRITNEEGGSNG